jgi:hypothetical protein
MARYVGRFGSRAFTLQLARAGVAGSVIGLPATYWEIEYQGRTYPWRPRHRNDESDLSQLMRSAIAYLRGQLTSTT